MNTSTPPPGPPPGPSSGPADGPPAEPPPTDGPRVSPEEMRDLGRLRRSVRDRHIAGVAGGLARHLDIDPIIVRVALVVLVFFGGAGLLLYAAGWLLVPEEGTDDHPLGLDERSRRIALMGAGVLAALAALGDWAGAFWFPWPVVGVALVVLWFLNRNQHGRVAPPAPGAPAAGAPPAHPGPDPYGSAYAGSTYTGSTYTGFTHTGPGYDPAAYARPRNPRKRGPVLFWATLALIALGIGVLGVVDAAGADVPAPGYPALAMTVTGVMLLVGAFWGRAGGLILLGLLAAVATAGSTAADDWEGSRITHTPLDAGEVRDSYDFDTGELTLDLSRVKDVDDLDGRRISVDGGVGAVEIVVPSGMDVSVDAASGVGEVRVFDRAAGGFGVEQDGSVDGGAGVPEMTIEADLGIGQVTVREQ